MHTGRIRQNGVDHCSRGPTPEPPHRGCRAGGPGARSHSRASPLARAAGASIAPALILLVGAALLVIRWVAARPLWLDEEMIAINIRDRAFRDLTGSLLLGQSAPLGWLALEHWFVLAFGTGERVLRLVPVLFGLGTLATAYW